MTHNAPENGLAERASVRALLARAPVAILAALLISATAHAQTTVSVTASDASAGETPASDGAFLVSADGTLPGPIRVLYSLSGSATAGDDYAALPGEVTLTPGQPQATIVVDVSGDDGVFEGEETVTITLTSAARTGDDDDDDDDEGDDDDIDIVGGPATVTIADSTYTVTAERTANATEDPVSAGAIRVSLGARNESGSPLDVSYSTGGTATSGSDYVSLSGTVAIPTGAESASIEITPLNDDVPEGAETVEVTITDTSDPRIAPGNPDTATVTISDDDEEPDQEVVISLTVTDDSASESPPRPAQVEVRRVSGSDRAVTLEYSVGGTASPGEDFDELPGTVTLGEEQDQASISINVPGDDEAFEGDETVRITLQAAQDVRFESSQATITIADSDHSVTVSRVSNASENPLDVGTFRVSLGARNASGADLRVEYDVAGTASAGSDYQALNGVAVIATGDDSVDIDITPLDDDEEEQDETVEIVLTGTSNPQAPVGEPSRAELVISADEEDETDDEVTVSVSAIDNLAGEQSGGSATFRISRVGGSDRAVTINYSVSGSASPGADYAALPGTVSLAQGESATSISIDATGNDGMFEGDETVTIRLLATAGQVSVADATASVTIRDSAHSVSVTSVSNASENPARAGELLVSLGARNESGGSLSIGYSVSGTATPGTDYQALNGTAVIPDGSSSVAIIVTPLDDDQREDEETVQVTLTGISDSRVAIGTPASATVSIADDDSGEDDDGDGVSNGEECPASGDCPDTDGDGVPDNLDPDDDGDGIPTAREGAPEQDTDSNGVPDYLDDDDDGDGRPTAEEDGNADGDGDPSTNPTDRDGDSVPDYLDADDAGGPAGDIDGDGLSNDRETELGTDPTLADTDGDGVGDGDEVAADTDPLDSDSFADGDGDLVPDAVEVSDGTDPDDPRSYADNDGGGAADHVETVSFPNAGIPATNTGDAGDDRRDLDGDGLPDRLEVAMSSNPEDAASPTANGAGDDDDDGVSNAVEAHLTALGVQSVDGTSDHDRDGYPDAAEVALGLNPLRADERDGDGDGVPDIVEAVAGLDIDATSDSDADGLPDARELALGFDFLDANSPVANGAMDDDGDGVTNAVEQALAALGIADDVGPDTDSDDDGLPDAEEIALGGDPSRDEQPVPWIELEQSGIGPVRAVLPIEEPAAATAVIGGHQTGTLSYDWSESDNAVLAVSSPEQTSRTLEFAPRTLPAGTYRVVVQVVRTLGDYGSEPSVVEFPLIVLADGQPSDVADADGDGIADAADQMDARLGFANELPSQSGTWLQAEPGMRLQLGSTARASGAASARVTEQDIASRGGEDGESVDDSEDEFEYTSGIYDFEITALPEAGASVQVVIPQASAIGEFPEYRKYQAGRGWFGFEEDANNSIASAAGSSQGCPAAGDDSYEPGLAQGHFCVQLTIEDGGPNDADADLGPNGIIKDPGGVATPEGEVVAGSGSGRTGPGTVLVLALLSLIAALRQVAEARRQRDAIRVSHSRAPRAPTALD